MPSISYQTAGNWQLCSNPSRVEPKDILPLKTQKRTATPVHPWKLLNFPWQNNVTSWLLAGAVLKPVLLWLFMFLSPGTRVLHLSMESHVLTEEWNLFSFSKQNITRDDVSPAFVVFFALLRNKHLLAPILNRVLTCLNPTKSSNCWLFLKLHQLHKG